MNNKKKLVCLIGALGGSVDKSWKKRLHDRPLIEWVIGVAIDSGIFDCGVWVSTATDGEEEISNVSVLAGVNVHKRSSESATDTTTKSSAEFLLDFERNNDIDWDVIALLQPTQPLTLPNELVNAWNHMNRVNVDSVISVVDLHKFQYQQEENGIAHSVGHDPCNRKCQSQLWESGNFYFITREALLKGKSCISSQSLSTFTIRSINQFDLEGPEDWPILENLVRLYGHQREKKRSTIIKLAVFDVDGVLTDGRSYYDRDGEAMKSYYTRDGAGISLLKKAGIEVGFISGESTPFHRHLADKWNIKRRKLGTINKLPVLDQWRIELGLEWDAVSYMGDDWFDVSCLRACGLSACPNDAHEMAKNAAKYICKCNGGRGAVREFIDKVIL